MSTFCDELGMQTDKLDNLIHALELPITNRMHIDMMRQILPEIRDEIRRLIIVESGQNPWRTYEDAKDGY